MTKSSEDQFSVITFNIWNGFERPKSKQNFIEFMREQSPDLVALQELCGFTPKRLKKLAASYGHPYVVLQKRSGYPVGATSKSPLKLIRKQRWGFWHGYLHCLIEDVHFVVIHLSPAKALYRQKEMCKLVEYLQRKQLTKQSSRTIVLGDFNSHSPHDADALKSRNRLRETYSAKNLVDNDYDFSIHQGFYDAGLSDALYHISPGSADQWTFPADVLEPDQEHMGRGERLDFQLVSPAMLQLVQSGEIVINPLTRQISDHYPVKVNYRRDGSKFQT